MGKIMYMDEPYSSTFENATSVKYSNTKSQIAATNAQDAIDELVDNQYKTNVNLAQLSNPNLLINGDFQVWEGEKSKTQIFTFNGGERYNYVSEMWCIYCANGEKIKCSIDPSGYMHFSTRPLTQFLEEDLEYGEEYVLSAYVNREIHTLNIIGGTNKEDNYLGYYSYENGFQGVYIQPLTGDTVVHWVKLEKGKIATPFVPRLYAEELMLCQRYYYVLNYGQYQGGTSDGKKVYIHSDWVLNNMRNAKTISGEGLGAGVVMSSGGTLKTHSIKDIHWLYNAIEIELTETSVFLATSVYLYFSNSDAKITINARIY